MLCDYVNTTKRRQSRKAIVGVDIEVDGFEYASISLDKTIHRLNKY